MHNRTLYLVLLLAFVTANSPAQLDSLLTGRPMYTISAGLGVSLVYTPDIVDYINFTFSPDARVNDLAASPEFYGSFNVQLTHSYGIELEYAYLLRSYNLTQGGFNLNFAYDVHMPTVMVNYLYAGNGFFLKVGAGSGYHFVNFSQEYLGSRTEYSARGIGLKLGANGNTAFDDHLFGEVGVEVRGDYIGELKAKDTSLPITDNTGKHIDMHFYSFALRFGLAYYF